MKEIYSITFFSTPNDSYRECFDIGIFASFEEAKKIAEYYKSEVKGFCEYECEYEIDEVSVIGKDNTEVLYRFCGWNVDENGNECDIIYSDCYSLKEEAERAFENMKKELPRDEWSLDKCVLGKCNWEEGFVRVYTDTEKTSCYTYFRIVGEFPTDEVIKMLGVMPYKVDESDGCANLDFALCEEYDVLVENMMRKTIEPFKNKIDILNAVRETYDVKFFLEVVPEVYVDETHPCLAPPLDVMDFCVKTQTEIDIDMYVYES